MIEYPPPHQARVLFKLVILVGVLFVLTGVAVTMIGMQAADFNARLMRLEAAECAPDWQCNGPKDTRSARCCP